MIAEMLRDMILDELFISSSVLILMVILVRFLFRNKISRRVQYALWLVVLVRLLVPVQIGQLSFSTSAIAEKVEQAVISQENISYASDYQQPEVRVEAFEADGYTYAYETVEDWQLPDGFRMTHEQVVFEEYLYTIYAVALFGLALWFILSNLHFRWKATRNLEALPVENCPVPVYISQGVTSPCLVGLFRQKILLPAEAAQDPERLNHIIAHELTHCRHGDLIWGFLRCVLLCIHWDHPLVWLAAFLSKEDCELACDEGAIARLGEEERIPYGETLLKMVSLSSVSRGVGRVATTMAESKKQLAQRILSIAKKRKFRAVVVVFVLCFMAAMIPVAFAGKDPDPGKAYARLVEENQKKIRHYEELPELQVYEGGIYEAYQKALTQTEQVVEYSVADLNHDGVPELALRRSNRFILDYGFYTYREGKAVPLSYALPGHPEYNEEFEYFHDYTVSLMQNDKGEIYAYPSGLDIYALRMQEEKIIAEQIAYPEYDIEQFQSLLKAAPLDFSLLDEMILGKESRKNFDLPDVQLEIPENWIEIPREELDGYVGGIHSIDHEVTTDGKSLGLTEGGGKYIPNILYLEDGRLEGWNGGLRYRAGSGKVTALIINHTFSNYYVADGRIFVLAGPKSVDGLGAFYEIYKEDGEYKAKVIYRLEDAPLAVATVEDYCFVITNGWIYVFRGDKIERITWNKGYSFFDSYFLHGENMIYANGCLYVGKVGHIMAFDINEESFTWYVPKEGWGKDEKYGKNL